MSGLTGNEQRSGECPACQGNVRECGGPGSEQQDGEPTCSLSEQDEQ